MSDQRGFTLLELLITISIGALFTVMVLSALTNTRLLGIKADFKASVYRDAARLGDHVAKVGAQAVAVLDLSSTMLLVTTSNNDTIRLMSPGSATPVTAATKLLTPRATLKRYNFSSSERYQAWYITATIEIDHPQIAQPVVEQRSFFVPKKSPFP